MTSVARLMPSINDSRQPYKLSNLDLVTESFTLIAGTFNSPVLCISYNLCTPVVVSSEIPLTCFSNSGNSLCITSVRSPPSSKIRLGRQESRPTMVCLIHHQYSSSDSPFQANTGTEVTAIAA